MGKSMATSDIIDDIGEESDAEPMEVDEAEQTTKAIDTLETKIKGLQGDIVTASERGDPETLSTLLLRLGRVNSALGRQAAYAKYLARNADRAYRMEREQGKLSLIRGGMAIGKAESQAYVDSGHLVNIYSEVQLLADQADDLCFRTDTFLKMAQSRLSLIKGDAVRG